MKKILIPCIAALLCVNFSYAQVATITGTVKDKSTQETLIGVNIVLENTEPTVAATPSVDKVVFGFSL